MSPGERLYAGSPVPPFSLCLTPTMWAHMGVLPTSSRILLFYETVDFKGVAVTSPEELATPGPFSEVLQRCGIGECLPYGTTYWGPSVPTRALKDGDVSKSMSSIPMTVVLWIAFCVLKFVC